MKRMAAAASAIALAIGVTVSAQESGTKTTTTTKTTGGDVKTMTYTGCVGAGTETKTYVLDKVMPVTTTRQVGAATIVSTGYVLVPAETIQIQEHVGRKVEVTGTLIPAGDTKTETKTKIEREDAKDTTIKQTTKTDNARPQFRVTSIKDLGERCD
jgi:hypothetical protein